MKARSTFINLSSLVLAMAAAQVSADAVTDWNNYSGLATKGATSPTTGVAGAALNSNVSTRVVAIEARAVFDAVNAVNHFSPASYYYSAPTPPGVTANSASAAAIAAAHDVLFALQPAAATRTWLDSQRNSDLAALGLTVSDPGYLAGQAAAAAALAARAGDPPLANGYIPSTNISATGTANATGNPGRGLWRPSNGAAGVVNPDTGAPTGFDAGGNILAAAGINFNFKNVTPFSLTTLKKQQLVAAVPPSLKLSSSPTSEYQKELEFVRTHGQEFSSPGLRTGDQLLQALYYKIDAELFANEAARIASAARNLTLNQNAKLFALLDAALADARIAAWQSKYDLTFWRPITAINDEPANGGAGNAVVTNYTWKPLATTPSHPAGPAGHSTTIAAAAQVLRSFFGSDNVVPAATPVTLTVPQWLIGTNNGTGKLAAPIGGKDGTTREVGTFSQIQLENGNSRLYLGVHFGADNYQGQALGLAVADAIINAHTDPATAGVSSFVGGPSVASASRLYTLLVGDSVNTGFYGGN